MTKESAAFVGCCILSATLVAGSAFYQGMPDPDHYRVYAEKYASIFSGRLETADAYRPPLYPLLIAPIVYYEPWPELWITGLHMLMMALILLAVRKAVQTSGGSVCWNLSACLLVAIDPILIYQSGQIMTELVFTAILMWTILPWLARGPTTGVGAFSNGLLAGIGFLTRPTMAASFAAIGVATCLQRRSRPFAAWGLAACALVFVVTIWWARNSTVLGANVWSTTHGGYTLWLANNPSFYKVEVSGNGNWAGSPEFEDWQRDNESMTRGKSELEKDRAFRSAALDWIADHPTHAARSALYRLASFWGLQPRSGPQALRPVVGAYYGVLFLLAALGWYLIRGWRGPWLVATLVVLALSLVHTVYWSNMRFRAPIEPLLAMWAAVTVDRLWHWRRTAT